MKTYLPKVNEIQHNWILVDAAGVPVGQLCKDMAFFTGNDGWKIKWIKFTGTPRQTPKRWKTTGGLAVRLR